ncbi:MAG: hypothetical protein Q4F84_01140 [Fibrobacter sp.]|nr:hypothetical protein [Fibrobacter sp.]
MTNFEKFKQAVEVVKWCEKCINDFSRYYWLTPEKLKEYSPICCLVLRMNKFGSVFELCLYCEKQLGFYDMEAKRLFKELKKEFKENGEPFDYEYKSTARKTIQTYHHNVIEQATRLNKVYVMEQK